MRRSSRVLAFGIALILLGIGNWNLAVNKRAKYDIRKNHAVDIGGEAVREVYRGTPSILDVRNEAHELYEDAKAKYDYYKIVHHGGRLLTAIGVALVGAALLRKRFSPRPSRAVRADPAHDY